MVGNYSSISVGKRLLASVLAIGFFFVLLLGRLLFLQVIDSSTLQARALSQWMRDIPIEALRGKIYDRNGVLLADSYTTYDVYVRPAAVENAENVASVLSNTLELNYDEVLAKFSGSTYSEVLIAKGIQSDQMQSILNNYENGILFSENTERNYVFNDLLTQVLGFTNVDGDGQTGLEAFYNAYLKGVEGASLTEGDIRGDTIDGSTTYYLPAIDGLDLHLTIDAGMQQIVESVLNSAMALNNPKSASCIVMQPQTGEILAMSTKPSFNLNEVPRDDVQELMQLSQNFNVSSAYEPGSTFKVIIAAIALDAGVTSVHDYFYCSGFKVVQGVKINCARRSGHGSQSLEKILCNSCNCGFMELAMRIGLNTLYDYFKKLKVGEILGVDVPGESSGVLMSKASVHLYDLARIGFGQAIAITPLQLVSASSACINGGILVQPYLVKEISTNNSETVAYIRETGAMQRVLQSSVSEILNPLLEKVVSSGGGKQAQVVGYNIGGKTGTAQKYENGAIAQGKYVASFLGFYPILNPEYIVLVVVDEPQGAYYGGVVAAPLASQIFSKIFELRETEKDDANAHRVTDICVPDVTGLTLTEACSKLAELGLYYIVDGTGGVVVDQYVKPNTMVSKGDVVLIIMSENDGEAW